MPKLVNYKPKTTPAKRSSARGGLTSSNGGSNVAAAPGEHEAMLVGLTDPFSPEAANARYPDQGAGKTLCWTQKFEVPLTTDAAGIAAFSIGPLCNFPYTTFASAAGSVITWPATHDAGGNMATSLLMTYANRQRPTSYGVRIVSVLSATNSAGRVIIAKGGPCPLGQTTTFAPNNFSTWDAHALVHGGEWHVTGHPISADAYTPINGSGYVNTTGALASWENIYIGVFGGTASVTALVLEIVLNYEYNTAEDAAISQLAVPQPVYSAPMITAINQVQSSHPPSHKGGQAVVRNFIKKEGKKALLKHVLPFVAKRAVMALA